MKKIVIQSIPYQKQRYLTSGDYWETPNSIEVRVNEATYEAEMLVAIHELVELFLTRVHGVNWQDIDAYDIALSKKHPNWEPGDQVDAPYYREHQIATTIEHLLCLEAGLTWKEYEKIIDKSCEEKEHAE